MKDKPRDLLAAALDYARRGWRIIPLHDVVAGECSCGKANCGSSGKHPRTDHGLKDGTTEVRTIRDWWRRWPSANVGVCTGQVSGVWMLGPDGQGGIDALAELVRQHGELPTTPTARSGSGGQHYYFRWPAEGGIRNRKNHRDLPIDVRGAGGYFVAPPSKNKNGHYEWVIHPDNCALADAPEWLLAWCRGDGRTSGTLSKPVSIGVSILDRAIKYLDKMPPAISGQGGHDQTMEAARVVVYGFDLGPEEGFRLLWQHYNPRCQPPWSEKELRHKCAEADTVPFGKPRGWLLTSKPPDSEKAALVVAAHQPLKNSVAVGGRPAILVTTEEHLVNEQAAAALALDQHVFQRGALLVRVTKDESPAAKGIRRPLTPRIEPLPAALLRERLAANARWLKLRKTGEGEEEVPAHPPAWCVSAVHARGSWHGVRHLEAVTEYPVLRPDGSVLCQRGYDPDTGLLLANTSPLLQLPDHPGLDTAIIARNLLLEVISDFPFAREIHRAAWVAALLTPLARFAFAGPAPLFLADANVRAAGKGLLLDCISRIITGERFTIATYTNDEDELRKRITSLVLAGDRLALFDNLNGKFGNAVLDAALTGTAWEDRLLGVNRMAKAPLYLSWYATGNNVALAADTARRVCHIRLESPQERPEERSDFRHPHLLVWIGEQRQRLLASALTILRAYFVAGRPDQKLPAWGSYEGWSALVRSAVVWVGMPDPGATRLLLQDQADVMAEAMALLLGCWEKMDPERRGLTTADVIDALFKQPPPSPPDYHADMRSAVETLIGRPDARALGNRLRSYRRRIFQRRFIDRVGKEHQAARWAVFPADEFKARLQETPHTPHTPQRGSQEG
jgi:hypothetical protein